MENGVKILVKISVGVVCKEDRAFCPLPTRWGPVLGGYTATVSVQPNAFGEMPPDFAPGALNVPQR